MHEDPASNFSSGSELPEEFRLLCMLHNIGATKSEASLNIQQISEWTRLEPPTLQLHLQKLVEMDYLQLVQTEGTDNFYLTINGIRKVLSLYS